MQYVSKHSAEQHGLSDIILAGIRETVHSGSAVDLPHSVHMGFTGCGGVLQQILRVEESECFIMLGSNGAVAGMVSSAVWDPSDRTGLIPMHRRDTSP